MVCDVIIFFCLYGSEWLGYIGYLAQFFKICVCVFIVYPVVQNHKHEGDSSDPKNISHKLLIYAFWDAIVTVPVVFYKQIFNWLKKWKARRSQEAEY